MTPGGIPQPSQNLYDRFPPSNASNRPIQTQVVPKTSHFGAFLILAFFRQIRTSENVTPFSPIAILFLFDVFHELRHETLVSTELVRGPGRPREASYVEICFKTFAFGIYSTGPGAPQATSLRLRRSGGGRASPSPLQTPPLLKFMWGFAPQTPQKRNPTADSTAF